MRLRALDKAGIQYEERLEPNFIHTTIWVSERDFERADALLEPLWKRAPKRNRRLEEREMKTERILRKGMAVIRVADGMRGVVTLPGITTIAQVQFEDGVKKACWIKDLAIAGKEGN